MPVAARGVGQTIVFVALDTVCELTRQWEACVALAVSQFQSTLRGLVRAAVGELWRREQSLLRRLWCARRVSLRTLDK
mgnify:CR=1 FL=1